MLSLSRCQSVLGRAFHRARPGMPLVRAMAGAADNKKRKVKIAQILVGTDKAALLDQAEQELQAGASFASVAEKYSECPSAKRGGELGWLARGVYFPQVEQAAYAAAVGELVRANTGRGHHLIKVLEEREEVEIQQMAPFELAELLGNPLLVEEVQFVDVRESWEYDTSRLPHFKLFPLSEFQQWGDAISQQLDPEMETVVLCHHGVRSMQMSTFLLGQGFTNVKNVTGGIDAYSRQVDSSVPMY